MGMAVWVLALSPCPLFCWCGEQRRVNGEGVEEKERALELLRALGRCGVRREDERGSLKVREAGLDEKVLGVACAMIRLEEALTSDIMKLNQGRLNVGGQMASVGGGALDHSKTEVSEVKRGLVWERARVAQLHRQKVVGSVYEARELQKLESEGRGARARTRKSRTGTGGVDLLSDGQRWGVRCFQKPDSMRWNSSTVTFTMRYGLEGDARERTRTGRCVASLGLEGECGAVCEGGGVRGRQWARQVRTFARRGEL
ncbi:hypothetical protein GOBAR_AA11743 [Gossypium barbadense]|uniref:Uncharacterized protein n=1 Tax=Gossypium barbadense TaxID=3634 RepID=A0A2P5Y024_GOSBA|nr:hypothetical protein GOBAR_AA11743 [Gossypium barbadense]